LFIAKPLFLAFQADHIFRYQTELIFRSKVGLVMNATIKLNLGCGGNHREGYINVDKYGDPDIQHDLESFPWPWPDSSVCEIVLHHVLEHLGQMTNVYLNIVKEIYRICEDQASIHIVVPHPRHDDFLGDPTHVRVITPEGISLLSKKNNEGWIKGGFSNSPLGLYLNVDFEITELSHTLDPVWKKRFDEENISPEDISAASKKYNNVIKEIRMTVKAVKN
jgi:hypothetical protein